jgi:hypothetical protein
MTEMHSNNYEMDEGFDENVSYEITYTPSLEYFLQRKGEECEAWSNLHLMSHKKFKKTETMFNLPIITITAFIGFVSGLNLDYEYIHLILGGMSLYASLLKSYFSYLKISQKSENHRIAYIQYGQIANEIRVELALEPRMRKSPGALIHLIRIKMKNLLEVCEIMDNSTIDEYISQLSKNNQTNVLHWFTRERRSDDDTRSGDDNLGRPHVLKLANRVESYVDIEKKVMQLPNAGRSMSSPHAMRSISTSQRITESNLQHNESETSRSTSDTTTNTNSSNAISGIMV